MADAATAIGLLFFVGVVLFIAIDSVRWWREHRKLVERIDKLEASKKAGGL